MSFYLPQYRVLKLKSGKQPNKFPAQVAVTITFAPEDAFGVQTDRVRSTVPKDKPVGVLWDANQGTWQWQADLIDKINASSKLKNFYISLDGNKLVLHFNTLSLDDTDKIVASLNLFLPALLSFHLEVCVGIKKFEVVIADAMFNLEVSESYSGIAVATKDYNTHQVFAALDECLTADDHFFRILSALYYYRHAKRLEVMQPNPESMMAEVILNLTKAVETIFSSDRDSLRTKAKECGFSKDFIEKRLIPLQLIRNQLDVGHASTITLNPEQRQLIFRFTHAAFSAVHELIEKVFDLLIKGKIILEPVSQDIDKDESRLLQAISQYISASPEGKSDNNKT